MAKKLQTQYQSFSLSLNLSSLSAGMSGGVGGGGTNDNSVEGHQRGSLLGKPDVSLLLPTTTSMKNLNNLQMSD